MSPISVLVREAVDFLSGREGSLDKDNSAFIGVEVNG